MKRVLLMLLMAICASTTIAQTTDTVPVRLDPQLKRILNSMDQGSYQMAMRYNDFMAAKNSLYQLMARNPENLRYPEMLQSIYFETGQYSSAALVALDILNADDKNIGALEIAAYSLEQLGALDRALPHFERLYLLAGDNFSLYKSGYLQYTLKKYQEALNSVNMLVKNAKADEKIGFPAADGSTQEIDMKAAALNLKGMVYLDQGSKVDAKSAFQEALALEPNFELAKENLKNAN